MRIGGPASAALDCTMREMTYAASERRGSRTALLPLSVLGAVFFIPTYRGCYAAEFRSPAHFATESLGDFAWIAPVFLCAAALALLTWRALARGAMDSKTRRLGLAALALMSSSQIGVGISWSLGAGVEWPWLAWALAAALVGGLLVRSAKGMRPWQIWEHLLGAFVLLASVSGPSVILIPGLTQVTGLGPGHHLYGAALISLWPVVGMAILRAHRRPPLVEVGRAHTRQPPL